MRKAFLAVLIIILCPVLLFAFESIEEVFTSLDSASFSSLLSGETVTGSTLSDGILQLVPGSGTAFDKASAACETENAFSVGIVSFVEYPDDWESFDDERKLLEVFNIMTSVSTQTGITYISRTAGYKEKVLIEDSYRVTDPEKKTSETDDPVFSELPSSFQMYSYQKDNRFGGNTFILDYVNTDNEIFLSITNNTSMKFMGVTCVEKEKLSMYIDVYLTEEGIVVFGMATICDREPEIKLLFYTIDLQSSFTRRITGMKDWFVKRVME